MISLNGLYATLRSAIEELTGIGIYQNHSQGYVTVDAKYLFVKVVYYLFTLKDTIISELPKPTYDELTVELGFESKRSIYRLSVRTFTHDDMLDWKLNVLKAIFEEYVSGNINKQDIIPLVQYNRVRLWVSKYYKIIEDEGIQTN